MDTSPLRGLLALSVALATLSAACGSDEGDEARRRARRTTTTSAAARPSAEGGTTTSTTTKPPAGPGEAADPVGHAEAGPRCRPVGGVAEADGALSVDIVEWVLGVSPQAAAAGNVLISVTNSGDLPHELRILRGDDAGELPTMATGAVDWDAVDDDRKVGVIGAFVDACEGTFEMSAGSYVLLCNLVAGGTATSHFAQGLHATVRLT